MSKYEEVKAQLQRDPAVWLVTGVAGFIGSNLLETLLKLGQRVVGLDNFATGHSHNLNEVQREVSPEQWANFQFIQGDIRNLPDCRKAMTFTPLPVGEGPGVRVPESLLSHARALRKNQTDAERLLWGLLRDRRFGGAKFRRQHPIGNYIADFFCHEHRLVIEVDGGQHADQQAYDVQRDTFLQRQGLTVLRFWNNQVLNDTDAVLQVIWEKLQEESSLTPTLSQEGRGGFPVDYVLHQAALGSVPRSIEDPITTNQANIDGFLNMLVAARDAKVKRFVYAASSSTYGDHPNLPKVEDKIGKPLSPYAVTKLVNELYADVFARSYGMQSIGLRYFNIFGKRQDPNGAYAAVIPKWIAAMIKNEPVYINGDGETSRDFCYIENAVQANLLAATATLPLPQGDDCTDAGGRATPGAVAEGRGEDSGWHQVFNIAVGERTSLNDLCEQLRHALAPRFPHLHEFKPIHRDFRAGDVRHSLADISKAQTLIGYQPSHRIGGGLAEAMDWYVSKLVAD